MKPENVYAKVWRTSDTWGPMQWMIQIHTPRVNLGSLGTAWTEDGACRKAARMVAREQVRVAKEALHPIRKEFEVR